MAKEKNTDIQDISVFPEGLEMNSWSNDGREIDISEERSRVDEKRPDSRTSMRHRGKLWFPVHEIPEGWTYSFMTERLLGEPQNDNLQEQFENGWDFVKQSDHPTYQVRELYENTDNRIRRSNTIIMKKPTRDYEFTQKECEEESAAKQRETAYLTDYFGGSQREPRFIVENRGSYTPNYVHKRG